MRGSGFALRWCVLAVALVTTWGTTVPAEELGRWSRRVAAAGVDPTDAVYPFRATEAMRAWAEEAVKLYRTSSSAQQLQALQRAMFAEDFTFEYVDSMTLVAAEAFEERRGNCMSFTAMFIAMARSLDIPAFLVSVRRQPEVERDRDLVVLNRHVVAGYRAPDRVWLFDFYVTSSASYVSHEIVDDVRVSALFHTNLGGEAIRAGDTAEAVRHLTIATSLAPDYAPAWVNLGVARFRGDDIDGAFDAYHEALHVDPGNPSALTNMAFAYRQQGMEREADHALRAAAEGSRNPFTLIAAAELELIRGDLERARWYLRRARSAHGDMPAVHDALARLARLEGNEDRARKHAERAAELRTR